MKKLSKLLLAMVLWVAMTATVMAQNNRNLAVQQKNNRNISEKEITSPLKRNPTVHLGVNSHANTKTTLVTYKALGAAANAFTVLGANRTRVAANNALNTIAYVHRGTASTGGSGTFKLDVSTNSGSTFTSNVAVYTNAGSAIGNGRYPQMVIHNPSGNTVTTNAFVAGTGALTGGSGWGGYGTYAAKFDGTSQSETATANNRLIPQTLHVANGIYWTVDYTTDANDDLSDTIVVLKGTWNSTLNKIDWVVNNMLKANALPYINPADSSPGLGLQDVCIAFAPNGMTGYVMMRGECTTKTVKSNTCSPVLWKTTDGGTTWALVNKDFGTFNIPGTTSLLPNRAGQSAPANFFYEASMTVDANGKVHIAGSVAGAAASGNDPDSLFYLLPNAHRGAVHIWGDGTTFTGRTIDSLQTYALTYVYTGNTPDPTLDENARMQISRTEDGTKVFFVYGDDHDATGFPDLYVQGFNVNTGNYTMLMSPTDGGSKDNGAHFHSLSPTVLGNTGCYELPVVIAEASGNDVVAATNFFYVDDISLCDAQFTVSSVNTASVTDVMTTFNAYPNPAAESVNFNYTLNNKANTELSIFALDGRVISTITKGNQAAGSYTYTFNRADLAAGVYMARFVVDGKVNHTKIVLQ